MQDLLFEEDTNKVLFPNARIYAHIQSVFAHWGFDVDQFTSRLDDMQAAYRVFGQDFSYELKRSRPSDSKVSVAMSNYLAAVSAQDAKQVRRWFRRSGITAHMAAAKAHQYMLAAAEAEPRRPRGDARLNPVLGRVLATPVSGARGGETLEDVFRALFKRALQVEKLLADSWREEPPPKPAKWSRKDDVQCQYRDLQYSRVGQSLDWWGLSVLEQAPRYDEVCVLFNVERLVAMLDISDMRETWRADLGPFVGFDDQFRLITEADLKWWRLENSHRQKRFGSPLGQIQQALPTGHKPVRYGPATPNTRHRRAKPTAALPELKVVRKVGILTVRGHVIKSADLVLLGGIAAMLGARVVRTDLDVAQFEPLDFRASTQTYHHELGQLLGRGPREVQYSHFHYGLQAVAFPAKIRGPDRIVQVRAWWTENYMAQALALIPVELRP
jgi:hypothetical protein